jgi:hypothetical protein
MKLLNANYEPKAPIFTLYILEGKNWMNSQSYSSTYIPHVSNQQSHATYNFSSFYGYVLHYLESKDLNESTYLTSHYYELEIVI